jgi:hypothetical protein
MDFAGFTGRRLEFAGPRLMQVRSTSAAKISWPGALTLVALIVAAVVLFVFWRVESWPGRAAHQTSAELEQLGRDLRATFVEIAHLQPRIKINDRVYLEQTTPTSELVVLTRRMEVEHEMQHTWAGSSKRVKLHGTFLAKAGFDLRQDFSVDVRPDSVSVQVPHARILGVEQERVEVLEFANGYWNRISGTDVQNELDVLARLAQQKAAEAGLALEAEKSFEKQLQARLNLQQPLQVTFTGSPPR